MLKYYDRAWNPVFGCSGCFAGCDRCYARGQMERKGFGGDFAKVSVNRRQLNRRFGKEGRELVCICSQSDLFQDGVEPELVDAVMRICDVNRQDEFITLTKHTGNMLAYFSDPALADRLSHNGMLAPDLENLKVGATICAAEDLHRLDELKRTPVVRHRFLAFEPLLEDVAMLMDGRFLEGFEWVVVGAETGPDRRPCPAEWVEGIVALADGAGVPVFVNAVDMGGPEPITELGEKPERLRRCDNPYAVR